MRQVVICENCSPDAFEIDWPEHSVPECPHCHTFNVVPIVPCLRCGAACTSYSLEHGLCYHCEGEVADDIANNQNTEQATRPGIDYYYTPAIPQMPLNQELEMDAACRYETPTKFTPCDAGDQCPFDASDGMDCRNYCGLGVSEVDPSDCE